MLQTALSPDPAVRPALAAEPSGRAEPSFDLQACQALMEHGSKSFFAASRVLPARVRAPAVALYAFCRVADDAIDLHGHEPDAMLRLHERLRRIHAADPLPIEADRAMACVVAHYRIPQELPAALLEGFAWDAQGRRYETLEDLCDYAARVAGSVGAMMTLIMGRRDAATLARACEAGVAMQFTNIARDVGEDARAGRLYLPRSWMREAGLDPDAWLRDPRFNPQLASVVARLLRSADELYGRAECGVRSLPRDCRAAILSARLVYAEIGREVERGGLDSVSRRAVVSGRRKLLLMGRALAAGWWPGRAPTQAMPALPAIRYLVDAALRAEIPIASTTPVAPRQGTVYDRTVRILEMVERARLRQRLDSTGEVA